MFSMFSMMFLLKDFAITYFERILLKEIGFLREFAQIEVAEVEASSEEETSKHHANALKQRENEELKQ